MDDLFEQGWTMMQNYSVDMGFPVDADALWDIADGVYAATLERGMPREWAEGQKAYLYGLAHSLVQAEVV